MTKVVVLTLLLALAWAALGGSFTPANLLLGAALGGLSLAFVRGELRPGGPPVRPLALLALAMLFVKELALSAVTVARIVLSRRIAVSPGIFAYPLAVTRDFEIALLANLITLTPGTLSVDVSPDRRTLFVHALDASDPAAARQAIREGFERAILRAFR